MYYCNNSVFGGRPWQKNGPARRSALSEGRRVKKEYRIKSKIKNQNVKRKDTEENAKGQE